MQSDQTKRSASPPTERVLGIIELLARQRGEGVRLADVARELGLSQSTAHAIIGTLCDRGWASRDPVDKTLTLGPVLELTAARADLARPRAHATRAAAIDLAGELGYPASVTELTGEYLILNFLGGGPGELPREWSGEAGDRIAFNAPFGPAFAAWATAAEQQAWFDRATLIQEEHTKLLSEFLAATRERGYSVEYMAPTLARTARLFEPLGDDQWSASMRKVIDEALLELATAGLAPDDRSEVTAISAPVFDRHGLAVMNIGIHPFAPLAAGEIAHIGEQLLRATGAISDSPARET